jgi:hypothetical protein
VSLEGTHERAVLEIGIDGLCVPEGASLRVEFLVDGKRVATRDFHSDEGQILRSSLRRHLPEHALDHARKVLPFAIVDRLRPLYVRLMTHPDAPGAPRFSEITWRIELPLGVTSGSDTQITLVIDEPHTPFEVGWSRDERPLGIHLRSLKLEV